MDNLHLFVYEAGGKTHTHRPQSKTVSAAIIVLVMSADLHKKYTNDLRGNQDVFLIDIMRSLEFQEIYNRHLEHVFTGIYGLLHQVDENHESGRKIHACAAEISSTFRISKENALDLILMPTAPAVYRSRYSPRISRDGDDIVIRIGQKTKKEDILASWKIIKQYQQEMGGSGSKQSINPELYFCIHRQYILKGRKMADVFKDYRDQRLEGYNHPPTITDEEEFRKRYKKVVRGL